MGVDFTPDLAGEYITCTSGTRPAHKAGRMIYETDTALNYVSNGTTWVRMTPTAPAAPTMVVCTSGTRPTQTNGLMIYETDTKFVYVSDGTTWQLQTPRIPHTDVVKTGTASGTISSITNVDLPTPLSKTGFVKYRSDTKLIVEVSGGMWLDDAVSNAAFAIDVAGVDTDIGRIDTIIANASQKPYFLHDFGTVAAGTLGTYKVQARVNLAATVMTFTGLWTMTMTETF